MTIASPPCKHLEAKIDRSSRLGTVSCPTCGEEPMLYVVFNNWLDELQTQYEELQEAKKQFTAPQIALDAWGQIVIYDASIKSWRRLNSVVTEELLRQGKGNPNVV